MVDRIKTKICRSTWLMPLGFALSLILFVLSIALCLWRGFAGMEARWVFNVGTDMVSI